MRDIHSYLAFSKSKLLVSLADTVTDLRHVHDQIGFVKSQELSAKRDAWSATPEASIQMKDRAASYSAISFTIQLQELEAAKDCLIEEKFFLIRLLDGAK